MSQPPTASSQKVTRTLRGWSPVQSSHSATNTAGNPASRAAAKTRDSWPAGRRRRSEPMLLEAAVEGTPAEPERLGGLAHVPAMALERLADEHALDLLQRQVLEPRGVAP